jgi:toxin HigB-1
LCMIISITHKGLRTFYENGLGVKLPSGQLSKIRRIFDMLDAVSSEEDIVRLGLGVHKLKGEYAGFWALSVTGNYRIVFRFHAGDVYDIDYLDYH